MDRIGEVLARPISEAGDRQTADAPCPVLIVCLSAGFGGADVRVLQIARGLHGRCDYQVATLSGSPLSSKLRSAGLNVVEMGSSRADPSLLLRFVRLLRRDRFDVVDAHNPQSQFWALLAAGLARIPVRVSSVHHVYGQTEGGPLKRLLYRSVLVFDRWLGCHFMAVSKEIVADLIRHGIDATAITQSNNAVDNVKPDDAPGRELKVSLGWDDDRHQIVGIFGRLAEQKGHRYLFESLARVRSDLPQLRCLVVGGGPLAGELSRLASDFGLDDIVHFTGFRNNVIDLMHMVDVIAQPSLYEGLPYTVLEAASLEKPMILSAVGGIPDYFTDRETALLIAPGDVDALSRALSWCCRNRTERDTIGKAARKLVERRFSVESVIDDTLTLYHRKSSPRVLVPELLVPSASCR